MILRNLSFVIVFFLIILQIQCTIPEVDDIDPPAVTIIYPYNGSTISGTTNVLVESTDDDRVTKVWLYIDDQLIGTQNGRTGNFQVDLSSYTDDQEHMILAAAEDKSGNRGFSVQVIVTITEFPDAVPPTVSIVNPLANQQVQDTVKVLASADDDRLVQNVAFFVNGDSVFNDNIYPYEFNWVTTNLPDSTSHSIFAKAFDQSGNWALSIPVTVTVFPRGDRTVPVLTLLYPAARSVLSGTVDVNVDASDNIGVTLIEFYVNGELIDTDNNAPWGFSWNTTILPVGTHSLYVKGFDAAGNVGVIPSTTYTIADNPDVAAPILTLLYPAAGSTIQGTVNVVVDVIDDVGVDSVQFFVDGILETTDFDEPWGFPWNTAPYDSGSTHTLYMKGFDRAGNVGTAGPSSFTVTN